MELYKTYPVCCTLWAFMEVVLFGGFVFGWGSLVYILKDEGFYLDLCSPMALNITTTSNGSVHDIHTFADDGSRSGGRAAYANVTAARSGPNWYESGPDKTLYHQPTSNYDNTTGMHSVDAISPEAICLEQDGRLNLWFSIAVTLMYFALTGIGLLMKPAGVMVTRIIFLTLYVTGLISLAFASPDVPWLILPGLCCVATSGLVVLATNLQVADLHPHVRSTIVAIFTGLFDFSTIVAQLVRVAYDAGISRKMSFVTITCLHVVLLSISTFFFLPRKSLDADHIEKLKRLRNKEDSVKDTTVVESRFIGKKLHEHDVSQNLLENDKKEHYKENIQAEDTVINQSSEDSVWSSLLSLTFLLHLFWVFVHALRFVSFIGQVNTWMEKVYSEDTKVGGMLSIFSYMTMGSIFAALLCGFIYDYMRKKIARAKGRLRRAYLPVVLPMGLVIIQSTLTTCMSMINAPVAPYLAFLMFTLFRSSLFTVAVAFAGDAFPLGHFAVLFGFIQFSAGLAGVIQYPMFQWYTAYDGSDVHMNIVLLALQLMTIVHPTLLYIRGIRDVKTDDSGAPLSLEMTVDG